MQIYGLFPTHCNFHAQHKTGAATYHPFISCKNHRQTAYFLRKIAFARNLLLNFFLKKVLLFQKSFLYLGHIINRFFRNIYVFIDCRFIIAAVAKHRLFNVIQKTIPNHFTRTNSYFLLPSPIFSACSRHVLYSALGFVLSKWS